MNVHYTMRLGIQSGWKVVALALTLGLYAAAARADNIDLKLNEQGPRLIKECKDRDYHKIGTLKFRVKVPGQTDLFTTEPLCSNLADRLENLLVMSIDPKDCHTKDGHPIMVFHAAGATAASQNAKVSYRTPQGRAQLFEYNYLPAWGPQERKQADAFFTGQVTIQPDLRTAEVQIEVFDRSKNFRRVALFHVAIDRTILADAGLSFLLDRKVRAAAVPTKLDQAAAAEALARRKEGTVASKPELLQVSVLLGNKESPLRNSNGPGIVPLPRPGQTVAVQMRNVSDQTLGVLLRVAGKNTLGEQIDEASRCRRWVLKPGEVKIVKGYQTGSEETAPKPFRIGRGGGAELTPAMQNLIDVQVFVVNEKEERRVTSSLRGLSEADRKEFAEWKLETLQDKIRLRGGWRLSKVKGRDPEPDPTAPTASDERLNNATFAEALRIRFEGE